MLAIRDRSSFANDGLKTWKSAIPAFRRLKTPKKRIDPTVASLLVSNMTKTDSKAINIGEENRNEIDWC